MERHDNRIVFNNGEFNLCGLGSIPVAEAGTTAAGIYAESAELFQSAFRDTSILPGDMSVFNRATELRVLAEKLEAHAPEVDVVSITDVEFEFEALLSETPNS